MTAFAQILSAIGAAVKAAAPANAVVYYGRAAPLPDSTLSINVGIGDSRQVVPYLGDMTSWETDFDVEIAAPVTPTQGQADSPDHAADAVLAQVWTALAWAHMQGALQPLGVTHYCGIGNSHTAEIAQVIRRSTAPGTTPMGRASLQITVQHHTHPDTLAPYTEDIT